MVADSPTPRRVTTPRWFDVRLVVGIVLVLVAVLLGATLVSRAGATAPVVATRHDLAAGTVLRSTDLTVEQVKLPDAVRAGYVGSVDNAVGRTVNRPVGAGELLPAIAVTHASAHTTLTVPFAAGDAPDLRTGQRIEVWVSTRSCASVVLLPDVTVQQVRADDGGSFESGSGGQDVVIDVPPSLAGRVVAALAIDEAQIRAGVLGGGAALPSASTSPATSDDDGLPADLARCTTGSDGS